MTDEFNTEKAFGVLQKIAEDDSVAARDRLAAVELLLRERGLYPLPWEEPEDNRPCTTPEQFKALSEFVKAAADASARRYAQKASGSVVLHNERLHQAEEEAHRFLVGEPPEETP